MNKLSLLAIFFIVSCSSIPKTTITNHNIQLTCEVGSFIYYFNLQDVPKKSIYVGDNAWYIKSRNTSPDLYQETSIAFARENLNKKYLLLKPYSVTEDVLIFATFAGEWSVNRYNLKSFVNNKNPFDQDSLSGTCEYGFQTAQSKNN